ENTFTGGLDVVNGMTVVTNGSVASTIWVDWSSYLYAWEVTLHGDMLNHGTLLINTAELADSNTALKGSLFNSGVLYNGLADNTVLEGNYQQRGTGTFMTLLGKEPLRILGAAHLDGEL